MELELKKKLYYRGLRKDSFENYFLEQLEHAENEYPVYLVLSLQKMNFYLISQNHLYLAAHA